ncbi:MAG: hypothetical protein WBQ44_16060 [Rhodococcus sp. (in: high G+C Gram-positive bacteria)]
MSNRHAAYGGRATLPDVGLYVDDERSIAAVSRPSRANPSLHVASLHSTVLYVHRDGSASLGGTDDVDTAAYTGFVSDTADASSSGFAPAELVAMTFRCLLAEVARSIDADVTTLAAAATFPSTWTAEHVAAVRTAMNAYGIGQVALVSESEALAAWAESTQATWAGSDSGLAAARGAASIASHYPVDAVTEEIPIRRAATPVWMRTPVLAAVAFAAVLALGGAVSALLLQDSTMPPLPQIEGDSVAAVETTSPRPAPSLPVPTVVPIAEPAFVPEVTAVTPVFTAPPTPEPTSEPAPEPTTPERTTSEPAAPTPPETRPVAETPTTPQEQDPPGDEPEPDDGPVVPVDPDEPDPPTDSETTTP